MKIDIEVKLKNPKSCEGCPLLEDDDYWLTCKLGFGYFTGYNYLEDINEKGRPLGCIIKFGE